MGNRFTFPMIGVGVEDDRFAFHSVAFHDRFDTLDTSLPYTMLKMVLIINSRPSVWPRDQCLSKACNTPDQDFDKRPDTNSS